MKSEIQFKFSNSFPVSSACLVYGLWLLCDACGYVYLICPYCLFLWQRYLFRSTPVHHPQAFNSLSNKQPFVMDWELEDKFTFIYPTQNSRTPHTHKTRKCLSLTLPVTGCLQPGLRQGRKQTPQEIFNRFLQGKQLLR